MICCINVTVNIMFSFHGTFWCSSSPNYSHIMLNSINLPPCIISSVCIIAQIFSRLTVVDDVLHLLPDSEGQVAQVTWRMNQSSRRHLWIRLWYLDSGRKFRIRTAVDLDQKQRDQRHQQITHLSIVTENFCRTNTQFIINNSINQSINQSMIWNQTFRKQTSLAFIISSMSLIVCERAEMCLLISSSFSFIICFFCSSSSLSAVIVASSSSLRNWWSFSNCCLIWCSVCSAWDWNQNTFSSIVSKTQLILEQHEECVSKCGLVNDKFNLLKY